MASVNITVSTTNAGNKKGLKQSPTIGFLNYFILSIKSYFYVCFFLLCFMYHLTTESFFSINWGQLRQ